MGGCDPTAVSSPLATAPSGTGEPHGARQRGYLDPMADFSDSTSVSADPQRLFDFLADVSNLPRYFARMTDARSGDGEEVKTTARMPDGQEVRGDAWFIVDEDQKRIRWGSEGDSDYHGSLEVTADDGSSRVEVHLHTERVAADDSEVPEGLRSTLTQIKQLVEDDLSRRTTS